MALIYGVYVQKEYSVHALLNYAFAKRGKPLPLTFGKVSQQSGSGLRCCSVFSMMCIIVGHIFVARIPIASTRSREHLLRGASAQQRCADADRAVQNHQMPPPDTASPVLPRAPAARAVPTDGRRTREPSSRTDRRRVTVTSSRVWWLLPAQRLLVWLWVLCQSFLYICHVVFLQ